MNWSSRKRVVYLYLMNTSVGKSGISGVQLEFTKLSEQFLLTRFDQEIQSSNIFSVWNHIKLQAMVHHFVLCLLPVYWICFIKNRNDLINTAQFLQQIMTFCYNRQNYYLCGNSSLFSFHPAFLDWYGSNQTNLWQQPAWSCQGQTALTEAFHLNRPIPSQQIFILYSY